VGDSAAKHVYCLLSPVVGWEYHSRHGFMSVSYMCFFYHV
jgi:hypothetical protein